MNPRDLRHLADDRIAVAEALLDADRRSTACFLAGRAVEGALKTCVAKSTNLHDIPDGRRNYHACTHSLVESAKLTRSDRHGIGGLPAPAADSIRRRSSREHPRP